jgi:ribokinase
VRTDVTRVVSFGSVNVDHVGYVDGEQVAALAGAHEEFPDPGETRRVEAVPDAVADLASDTHLGGKGANQAVAAARAGADDAGVDAAFLGKVGTDADEWAVLETLADRGVDVSGVAVADRPTGSAYVLVDETGENYILVRAGANGAVDADYVAARADRVRAADCLLVQNELPVATGEAVLALLDDLPDDERPTVVCDPAPADGAERLVAHPAVDVVTPNETEYAALSASGTLDDFDGVVVQTRGPEDLLVTDRRAGDERSFAVTPPTTKAVDTTGAGDVFCGYLAVELARERPLRGACRTAVAAAACSTEREGVQAATPTRAQVERFAALVGFHVG